MNIYCFEIYKRIKTLIIMPLCIGLFTFAGMGKFEGLQSSENARALYSVFPRPIQIIFGINDLDLTTLAGYMGTIFLYFIIIFGVYAAYLGVDGVIGEKINKQIDFVFTLPIARSQLFIRKVFAHLSVLIMITLLSTLAMLLALLPFKGDGSIGFLVSFQGALLVIQCLFYGVGTFIGVVMRNKFAVSLATGSVVLFYFIGVVIRYFEWRSIYFVSPFTSLSAVELLASSTPFSGCALYGVLAGCLLGMSYYTFLNIDI